MKSKQYTDKPVALRFRRWSRKGYAAFISIQRAVTIGKLTANVSERFEVKNGSIHTSVLSVTRTEATETAEEEICCMDEWSGTTATLWQLPALLLVQTIQHSAAAAYAYTFIYNTSKKAESLSLLLKFSAFSVYTNQTIK